MFQLLRAAGLLVLPAVLALPALAQPAGAASAEPMGQERPLPYRSALDGYRPFADQTVGPWTESNATVGQIGGWRAYAREAQGGQAAPVNGPAGASPPAAAGPAAADPHAGHGKH